MKYLDDLLEGASSVYDFSGDKYFNEYKNYPGSNSAIRNIWFNVGCHIDNATNQLAKDKKINNSNFKRKCTFEDF